MRALGLFLLCLVALPAIGKTCVDCHSGAAERSWVLSKHGVIARIESGRQPKRAPDCAACHVIEATAPAPNHYGRKLSRAQARAAAMESCRACHSPRYTTEQNAASARGLAIGDMKRREAETLLAAAREESSGAELARIEKLFATLRDEDLRHLRLGLAHQSPDY